MFFLMTFRVQQNMCYKNEQFLSHVNKFSQLERELSKTILFLDVSIKHLRLLLGENVLYNVKLA